MFICNFVYLYIQIKLINLSSQKPYNTSITLIAIVPWGLSCIASFKSFVTFYKCNKLSVTYIHITTHTKTEQNLTDFAAQTTKLLLKLAKLN